MVPSMPARAGILRLKVRSLLAQSCLLECLMLERIGVKGQVTDSRFGSGTAGATGTGATSSRTEFRMDHLFAMMVIGFNPVAARLPLRARHRLFLPIDGKMGEIERLRVLSLPSRVFWHWPKECNPLLVLRTGQHLCPQVSRIDNMLIGEQFFRFQRGMNGFDC